MTTVLNLDPIVRLTRERFYQLCLANPDASLERSALGKLIVGTPVGGESGSQEARLITTVGIWNEQT